MKVQYTYMQLFCLVQLEIKVEHFIHSLEFTSK